MNISTLKITPSCVKFTPNLPIQVIYFSSSFQCTKEPPSAEVFLKLVRQSDDLEELRACRHLLTQEMDLVNYFELFKYESLDFN